MIEWITSISPIVFTRIKTEFSEKIKTKYNMENKNFSTVEFNRKNAVFPFVYVKQMQSQPISSDLERCSVSGMDFYFQIEVYDNQSEKRTREIMNEILRIMVGKLKFQPKPAPYMESTNDVYRAIVRFERKIDWNDVI